MAIHVLLIDDDEDDFVLMRDYLNEVEGETYVLDWAKSYEEGIEAAKKRVHQVFLIDFRLGEFSGLDLLRHLIEGEGEKADKKPVGLPYRDSRRIPMILLTGQGDRHVDIEAMQVGAADYLVKGQLSSQILARSIRYSIKHAQDLEILREREEHILHQDRLASVGLLASGLAHEIGTPLGVIRGRAEYLAMLNQSSEVTVKSLEVIISQIDRISKLIFSLLNLARRERIPELRDVRVREVLDQVAQLMSHELQKNGVRFDMDVAEEALVRAEWEPLTQIFLNFFVNSIHAIQRAVEQGRVTGHRIAVSLVRQDNFCAISFEDTGCGISEADLAHVFKPFFTTKGVGVGTGLGLATCEKIVQSWGGSLDVRSKEGEWTVFRVVLKLS